MSQSYGRLVSRAAIAVTAMAPVSLLIKIFVWWYTDSISTLAALVDPLADIAASPTNLLAVRYSLQPADEEHTFGYGKAESLAALAQNMFTSGSMLFLSLTGIQHLMRPKSLQAAGVGVVVTLIALFSMPALMTFQRWAVRKTQNQAVQANMLHYQFDVMMDDAIPVALGLSRYGWHRVDALFALGVGTYILCNALRTGHEAIQSLLDRTLPDEERQDIIIIVTAWPGIRGAHDLRTRQSGPTRFIQIHLKVEGNLPPVRAYMVADQMEQAILRRSLGSDIIIHQDPSSVMLATQQGFFECQVIICKLDVKMWGRSVSFA